MMDLTNGENLSRNSPLIQTNNSPRDIITPLGIRKPWKQCTAVSSLLGIISSACALRPKWGVNTGGVTLS